MIIALRLAVRQWVARPLRPILCSIAIAAAVMLIVGVGAGMDSYRETLRRTQNEIVGNTDVTVRLFDKGPQFRMSEEVIEKLKKRPEVAAINGRMEGYLRVTAVAGAGGAATATAAAAKGGAEKDVPPYEAIGIEPETEDRLHPKTFAAGGYPVNDDQIIVEEAIARELKAAVGDKVIVDGMRGHTREAVLAGIVQRPSFLGGGKTLVFVPAGAMVKDLDITRAGYNVIEIELKGRPKGEAQKAMAKAMGDELGKDFSVQAVEARKNSLEKTSKNMDFVIVMLSIISGVCAALIVATTLSVGIQERLRQFGQLRCIGASRGQLMTFLAAEALLLVAVGVAVGLVLGYLASRALILHFPQTFSAFVIQTRSLVAAGINGLGSTLLGTAIPAWQISRITPMQAVSLTGRQARSRGVIIAAVIGVGLLTIQAMLWAFMPNRDLRVWSYLFVGIPFIFAGYCLLGPAILLASGQVAARVFGTVLRVRPALLRQTWSRTPWRAGGMIAALMIGVVMYETMRLRTDGIVANWEFPKVFPDVILMQAKGAPLEEVMRLKEVEGVTAVTGIGVGIAPIDKKAYKAMAVRMGKDEQIFGSKGVLESGNTRFAAIDVDSFKSMVELEFVQGDPKKAMERLKQGRAILVSREFTVASKINVGDKIPFKVRVRREGKISKEETIDFEVAGVVKSAGIEIMQSYFDMKGNFEDEAVSSVLGTMQDGATYFGIGAANLVLVNMDLHGRPADTAVKQLRDRANGKGGLKKAGFGLRELLINSAMPKKPTTEPVTEPASGEEAGMSALSTFVATSSLLSTWQAVSVIDIKMFIEAVVGRMVRALTSIAIAAMGIASLGVANMVIASMQARSFEFGVLRAIGTGRGQLLRMVLAEISVISLAAGALGTLASLHLTYMGARIDRTLVGYMTPFMTPALLPKVALHVLTAMGITVLLGWLAAVVPAARTAYRTQRELLAAGRG